MDVSLKYTEEIDSECHFASDLSKVCGAHLTRVADATFRSGTRQQLK
jgi:hypothetical protein